MGSCGCGAGSVNDYIVPVVKNIRLTERIFWMTFKAPELARSARPGQCVMIFPSADGGAILGRPFEVADADQTKGEISVCVMETGRGTALLKHTAEGTLLRVRGFLGVPYPSADNVIMAGGGVGVAGFLLAKKQKPKGASLFVGIPGKGYEKFAGHIKNMCPDAMIFTDDGSFGDGDSMFKVLPKAFDGEIWCCGPAGFLKAMRRHYSSSLHSLFYSLDKRMACGYGGCMGCVVKTAGGLKRVCVDQSLFRADEVNIDDN